MANALRGIAARGLAGAIERATEVAPGIVIDTGLLDGPPAAAVPDSGAGAQLLVVGARAAGGFSRRVAACAPCPVVVVRVDTVAVHSAVVVGVRDPGDADDTLGFAFEEASPRGANLTAVHQQKYPEVSVRQDVVRGHPARVLANLSARADLVIIGRHGAPDDSSILHAVLCHAHGPVAIVPAGPA